MSSLFAASLSWLRRLPWPLTVSLVWLALVSLYPVFLGEPSHPSASSAVLSQVHRRESGRDASDVQVSEMLAELAQLRERALQMQSSLEQALQSLPTKEDVRVTVEQRVVETILVEPDLSLAHCPPPPQYVLDNETQESLQSIREHQQRVLAQCEEVHVWMHSVTSAPPREVHCESVDTSRAEVLQSLAETHTALREMREEASRLDTRLTDTQTHTQAAMQSLEERLRVLLTATHTQASEQEENLRLLSVFREKFDRHAQAFAALLQSEREKARVLENINSDLANRPTPVCPPPPVVVPAANAPEACPAQPAATVNETALYEHVEKAVEEYVQSVLPHVESSLRETLRAELPRCAPSAASVNGDDNEDKYVYVPVNDKEENHNKHKARHFLPLDHALLTTGTKVVKSASSPTFVPEDYRVGKKLQRMFSGTVIEPLIPDSDGQEVLDTLGVDYGVGDVHEPLRPDTDKGRCWAMKGTSGNYTIRLSTPVHIKSVTLFHLPWESSPNVGSALKNFVVHAAVDDSLKHWRALGGGEYNAYVGGYQHFSMDSETIVRFVRLEILDNHGKQDYTCLYRFSVHEDE